ncbi:hypothetical protein QL093DRAFT_2084431 [Fusarium oxysporum]|nr:hypothetical protein QL093DRAFT_2084431 [Fusarium oxysporum]
MDGFNLICLRLYNPTNTGAVQIGNVDLVSKFHDLESQLAQATKDKQELSEKVASGERQNERLLRKLSKAARDKQAMSEKVESHELEIERLSRELAEKDKVHKRDSKPLSTELSEKHKKIESAMERI